MIDLIKQYETIPDLYPVVPSGLSSRAAALDGDMIWARFEAYTAYRFTEREVVWTLTGDGGDQWHPPLTPLVSRSCDVWGDQWESLTLADGPLGLCLPFDGTYRITAQVGAGEPPAPVFEAFRRLAEYLADTDDRAGVSQYTVNMGGAIEERYERNPAWVARAAVLRHLRCRCVRPGRRR